MNAYTLVLLKPSALQRGLCGKVINRYEQAGLMIERLELKQYNREVFEKLYEEHRGKSFYDDMVNWMSSEPIIAVVLSGPSGVVEKVRALNGATDPVKAVPGSIRGDYANSMDPDNVVHASDSAESARREIRLFFKDFRL